MDADVVVVGGGPSGLTVAGELALAGVRVLVLERRKDAVSQSRAGTVLPRVLELLDARGLAETFIARARRIRANPLFPIHIWAGMQPVHWSHLGSRFGFRLILPQNVTEELLLDHARRAGAEVRHGVRVRGLRQDGDAVRLDVETTDGPATLSALWVVGADGGRSAVREAAGIPFEGHDGTFTGIAADVTLRFPWPDGRRMVDNERGWVTSFPFGETDPVTRFNLVHAERRRAPQSEPVTVEEVRRCVADILGTDVPMDELRWGSRFTDAMRRAPRWREGRVLLVGEACRIHYPASGVGMNFCIQDAFNLGWKLAAVVNGHADDALLDTYQAERMPVTDALLQSVRAQVAVQFNFTPEGVAFKRTFQAHLMPMAEVNSRLAHELNGLTEPYPAPPGSHKLTGERVPDIDLVTPGGELRRVGEMLRGQRFLLIDLTGNGAYDADPPLGDGLPVERVSGAPVLVPDKLRGVTSLLVRPDAYVAWAGTGAPSPAQAANELANWLRPHLNGRGA